MRGFSRFLVKEATEIARTWRIWTLPGVLLFLAVTGPILAKLTPQLLVSLSTGTDGVVIKLPQPSAMDAYGQWIKNLTQIGVFLLIGVSAGMVSGERTSGTAALVLTKPVSRPAFVVAKYLVHSAMLAVMTALGTLATWGVTAVVFPEAPPARLFEASALWLAFGLLLLAVTLFWSAAASTLAALGASVASFVVLGLFTLWGPTERYTPAGLVGAPNAALSGTAHGLVWPLLAAAATVLLLVYAATRVFSRKEI